MSKKKSEPEKMVQLLVKDEKRDMWYPHEVSESALNKLKRDFKIKGVDEIVKHHGKEKAMVICMEELAELLQVIPKAYRYGSKSVNLELAEEMADVSICLDILCEITGIHRSAVEEIVKAKMTRILKSIDESKNGVQESIF